MSAGDSDVQAAVEAGIVSAAPFERDPSRYYGVALPENGVLHLVNPAPDAELPNPRRATGTSKVFDVDSLEVLWSKHSAAASELFGDPHGHTITGVLNADEGQGELAGHRDHRVVLVLVQTLAWREWLAHDGEYQAQIDFANFIEDHTLDIEAPSGAEMLELAQSIEASTSGQFKSSVSVHSGVRTLMFEETHVAKAGQTGQLEIPTAITLALQPFEGGDRFRVTARFRYRINQGRLLLGYKIDRPEDVIRTAFLDVAEKASQACSREVLIGEAPGPRA